MVSISSQPDLTTAPPGGYLSSAPLASPLNSSAPLGDPPFTSACDPLTAPPGDNTSAPDTPPCDPLGDPYSPPPPSRNAPFASPGKTKDRHFFPA